jgi:hypothetical protein
MFKPDYDQLMAEAPLRPHETPASAQIYQVMVHPDKRHHRLALALIQEAKELLQAIYGQQLRVRSVSPLPENRLSLARLVGARIQVKRYQQKKWESLQRLPQTEVDVAREQLLARCESRARIEACVGMDLVAWLQQVACRPEVLWETTEEVRTLMKPLIAEVSELYAQHTYSWSDRRPALFCWPAHFHRRQGGRVDGFGPLGRRGDREGLFTTVSFDYSSEVQRRREEKSTNNELASLPSACDGDVHYKTG